MENIDNFEMKESKNYSEWHSIKTDITSNAILSQVRLIDSKRLNYKPGYISKGDFTNLKEKLKQLIA